MKVMFFTQSGRRDLTRPARSAGDQRLPRIRPRWGPRRAAPNNVSSLVLLLIDDVEDRAVSVDARHGREAVPKVGEPSRGCDPLEHDTGRSGQMTADDEDAPIAIRVRDAQNRETGAHRRAGARPR